MDDGEDAVPLDHADLHDATGAIRTHVHHETITQIPCIHGERPGVSCICVGYTQADILSTRRTGLHLASCDRKAVGSAGLAGPLDSGSDTSTAGLA